jgi:diacylglycerol kinase family enzyme
MMHLAEFSSAIAELVKKSPLAREKCSTYANLRWTVIANPAAGGFTIGSRWKKHSAALNAALERVRAGSPCENAGPSETALEEKQDFGAYGVLLTQGPGRAGDIMEDVLKEAAAPGNENVFMLVITAGGDGTILEAQSVLYAAKPEIRARFAMLRLPMGTGNDGADGWTLDEALELLLNPVEVRLTPALKLSCASGKGPFLAFNILSIGLDAFVTHMTNRMKDKFPGDSYKLWVDIASLLYDRIYKVGPLEVKAVDADGASVADFTERVLLLAVGASGHRTYGAHNRILPDDRNVCVVEEMPLLRKVALKDLFTNGTHINKPESKLFNAKKVQFTGVYKILAQMDGEAVLLDKYDFPASIELTEPVVPVLKKI